MRVTLKAKAQSIFDIIFYQLGLKMFNFFYYLQTFGLVYITLTLSPSKINMYFISEKKLSSLYGHSR